jgi:hypothetical protein
LFVIIVIDLFFDWFVPFAGRDLADGFVYYFVEDVEVVYFAFVKEIVTETLQLT